VISAETTLPSARRCADRAVEMAEALLAGDPHPGRRQIHPRRPDHPRRMGTPHGVAPAVHLSPPGPSLLVAEGRLNSKGGGGVALEDRRGLTSTVPIFLLVPQVKLRKRLDLARDAERAHRRVPGLINLQETASIAS
jgi:hypothetical protein